MGSYIKKIKTKALSRAFSVAKLAVSGSVQSQWIKWLEKGDPEDSERWKSFLKEQAIKVTGELGQLKGSLMKAGQIFSIYGERLLPKEANDVLKTLQNKSLALDWSQVREEFLKELGPALFNELEISEKPLGAASLGQVHFAIEKKTGRKLALKLKYPGVEEAIESDLKILKTFLGMAGLIPRNIDLSIIFGEAKKMLQQEVNYAREFELLEEYGKLLEGDARYVVPKPVRKYSNRNVLCMSFEEGLSIDAPEVESLSQERKNKLAYNFFDLFMREIAVFGKVQTDSHFGNYQIRLDPQGNNDQWVLFDFGALRELPSSFLEPYLEMLRAAFHQDEKATHKALVELGLLASFDMTPYAKELIGLSFLVTEPVKVEGVYDWEKSDLPERVIVRAKPYLFDRNVRLPPAEMMSLDRKVGGVFTLMVKLKAKIHTKTLVENYLFNS